MKGNAGNGKLRQIPQDHVEVREVVVPGLQNWGVSGYAGKVLVVSAHMMAKNVNVQAMFTISLTSPDCTFV